MKQSFRQSMAWLHTWVGLVPGWVLYLVFLFGTVAFFQREIDAWMRPELPAGAGTVSPQAIAAADRLLRARGTGAESWSLSLPQARGGSGLEVSWRMPGQGRKERTEVTLDPATGRELAVRETRGGFFLYRFHFDLHYIPIRYARILVCLSALAMLVAILSGVVTHKKIFADFFQLRFGKGQRSWLDAHNVGGVLALPFHLMITYTGLITLVFTLMPWALSANFPDRDAYYEASNPPGPEAEASGKAAPVAPLAQLLRTGEGTWGGADTNYLDIKNPGDSAAIATLHAARSDWSEGRREPVYLDAVKGAVLASSPRTAGDAAATQRVMIDLHTAWFAGYGLRWLYFLSGVVGTAMCMTGLVLWTVKRRAKLPDPARPHFGFRLVERLNIGFIAGAPVGIAVYFLANRLLPTELANRADWEVNGLFIAWGATFVWTLARPTRRAWIEGLTLCAALFALVPAVSALTTARGLVPSLLAGDWRFVGFDLTVLATAVAAGFAAWRVANHKPKRAPARRKADLVEAAA
jgi:uncharacterized iron-regulated membrane protein